MAVTLATLNGTVADLIGDVVLDGNDSNPNRRVKVYVDSNAPDDYIADLDNNVMRLGTATVTPAADGTFSFADLIATGSADTNLDDSANLQYTVTVDYPQSTPGVGQRRVREAFGPFELTATSDITDLVATQTLTVSYASEFMTQAQALLDAQVALSGIDDTDSAIAAIVEDPVTLGPLTGAALSATYAPKVDLTHMLGGRLVIAHRGGHLIHGEHSLESYVAAAEQGFAIEPDVQILSDGGLACIHDATTTRTMVQHGGGSVQSTVSLIDSNSFVRDYRILPELGGSPYERPVLLPEVLDQFGGRTLIVPEMKDTATREDIVAEIEARGLQKSVLCQSFNWDDVVYSASHGIPSMWLTDVGTPATILAAGVGYVGVSTSATESYINSCLAAGLEVIAWTVNSRTQADYYFGLGCVGIFSDDPQWTSGKYPYGYTDPYRKGVPWPHLVTTAGQNRSAVTFANGGVGMIANGGFTATQIPQDWCPLIATGLARIYFTIEFRAEASAQTRWVGLAFGQMPQESAYADAQTTGQNVLHILMRREGKLQIYTNLAASGVALQTDVTMAAAMAAAGKPATHRMKFERTSTAAVLTDLDTGESATYTNSTNIWANSRFSFNFNGTDAIIRDVLVQPI